MKIETEINNLPRGIYTYANHCKLISKAAPQDTLKNMFYR